MCGKSWSAWQFTYHYAWACPEIIEIPPTNYISTDQIKEDERSRETDKGPVQNPSENSLRIFGETKISIELGVRSKSRDEQLLFC